MSQRNHQWCLRSEDHDEDANEDANEDADNAIINGAADDELISDAEEENSVTYSGLSISEIPSVVDWNAASCELGILCKLPYRNMTRFHSTLSCFFHKAPLSKK